MIKVYTYNLTRSGKIVGQVTLSSPIFTTYITVLDAPSPLKQRYSKNYKRLKFPIVFVTNDDGIICTIERQIDVSRKSKRQIALLGVIS